MHPFNVVDIIGWKETLESDRKAKCVSFLFPHIHNPHLLLYWRNYSWAIIQIRPQFWPNSATSDGVHTRSENTAKMCTELRVFICIDQRKKSRNEIIRLFMMCLFLVQSAVHRVFFWNHMKQHHKCNNISPIFYVLQIEVLQEHEPKWKH